MKNKALLTGIGIILTMVLAFGTNLVRQSLHAQQNDAPKLAAVAPLAFEVRDHGVLTDVIYAEGGMDPATKELHKVTLVRFSEKTGQVIEVVQVHRLEIVQYGGLSELALYYPGQNYRVEARDRKQNPDELEIPIHAMQVEPLTRAGVAHL